MFCMNDLLFLITTIIIISSKLNLVNPFPRQNKKELLLDLTFHSIWNIKNKKVLIL
jgi:hypothetical protein